MKRVRHLCLELQPFSLVRSKCNHTVLSFDTECNQIIVVGVFFLFHFNKKKCVTQFTSAFSHLLSSNHQTTIFNYQFKQIKQINQSLIWSTGRPNSTTLTPAQCYNPSIKPDFLKTPYEIFHKVVSRNLLYDKERLCHYPGLRRRAQS